MNIFFNVLKKSLEKIKIIFNYIKMKIYGFNIPYVIGITFCISWLVIFDYITPAVTSYFGSEIHIIHEIYDNCYHLYLSNPDEGHSTWMKFLKASDNTTLLNKSKDWWYIKLYCDVNLSPKSYTTYSWEHVDYPSPYPWGKFIKISLVMTSAIILYLFQ